MTGAESDVRLVPARQLVIAPVDVVFRLAPGDRPLVAAGESVVVGAPIAEHLRDPGLEEVLLPATHEAQPGDRWSGSLDGHDDCFLHLVGHHATTHLAASRRSFFRHRSPGGAGPQVWPCGGSAGLHFRGRVRGDLPRGGGSKGGGVFQGRWCVKAAGLLGTRGQAGNAPASRSSGTRRQCSRTALRIRSGAISSTLDHASRARTKADMNRLSPLKRWLTTRALDS